MKPPLCDRCGKHHGQPWIHKGDCPRCKVRPLKKDKRGRPMATCAECEAEFNAKLNAPSEETSEEMESKVEEFMAQLRANEAAS